jgi:phospholipid/cholesterol/gamma-HCH transport system substrate-binding protein
VKETLRQPKFRYTNETVGVFVLMALLIFVAGLIYSGKARKWFNPGETLKVVLPDDGLFGLTEGSTVEILGTKAGEVHDIVINPNQEIHANVRIDSEMAVFVRSDSKATIRKTFGIAGDAYLEITRGTGKPLDWEYAVITVESDRKTSDTLSELIEELRAKVLPVVDDAHKAILILTAVAKELQDPDKGVQQLLANLNSIADKIDSGEGTIGRMLTDDKLVRDLEALIARMGPIFDDLKKTIQNVSEFSAEFNIETGDIPEITRRLKETLASMEMVMKDIRQTTPQLPKIVKITDSYPNIAAGGESMIFYLRKLYLVWLIGLLIAGAILAVSGCGSAPPKQEGPAIDEALERFNRAARLAFDKGRLQQAASFYRKALERAYVRDDTAAILDAQYNLAFCLMNLQSYEEALGVVRNADTEIALAGRGLSVDFLLLEATILHRSGNSAKAWKITDKILSTPTQDAAVIQSKTHFLRGLIASKKGDIDQLRAAIAALGQPEHPLLRADRQELVGHLAMAEQNWGAAVEAFDGAAKLRREALDYRAMVKVLALAGKASEKAGRSKEASIRYLRAGRSAVLQGLFDDALKWLNRAEQIADTAGETQIAREARIYLGQIEDLTAAAP